MNGSHQWFKEQAIPKDSLRESFFLFIQHLEVKNFSPRTMRIREHLAILGEIKVI